MLGSKWFGKKDEEKKREHHHHKHHHKTQSDEDQPPLPPPEELFSLAECPSTCDSCSSKFPSSIKIDNDTPLWGSTKPWAAQFLIATGKNDWIHSIEEDLHSVANGLSHAHLEGAAGGRIMISNSSLFPPNEFFLSSATEKPTEIIVLPHFIQARDVLRSNSGAVANAILTAQPHELPKEVDGAKIEPCPHDYIILLCSHRTRDKRCGITAPILKKEFEIHLRDAGLLRDATDRRPGGAIVYYISHVGGHKFAGNVIIYRRQSGEAIWLGRITPAHVQPIVEETVLHGRVWPELLRGGIKAHLTDW